MLQRRHFLQLSGGLVAALISGRVRAQGAIVEIRMVGNVDGSDVWFEPIGMHVEPGQTIRWTNEDAGNSHTTTAYHPDIRNRPLRIPKDAKPWDSDYLLPHEQFSVTLSVPGIYDYYCRPHENAGMVGRIIVGAGATNAKALDAGSGESALPAAALKGFPPVDEIVRLGAVRRT
jgi:plastocyanin